MTLLDTNILLSIILRQSRPEIGGAVGAFREGELMVAPQSFYEFYTVATRPTDVNGFGLTPEAAGKLLERVAARFASPPDPPGLREVWLALCVNEGVSGKNAHDARLAAFGLMLGATSILTLNPGDFRRFGLRVLTL